MSGAAAVTPLHCVRHRGPATPGPTLVLVHGWACAASDWDVLVPGLRRLGSVVAVDLPGAGGSAPSAHGYTLPVVARQVAGTLDRLAPAAPVVLVGHSAGAEVVLAAEQLVPGVAGLVMVEPAYGADAAEEPRLRAIVRRLAVEDPAAVAREYFRRLDGPATPPHVTEGHAGRVAAAPEAIRGVFHEFAFGPGSFHFRPRTDARQRARRAPLLAVYRDPRRAAAGREFATRDGDRVVVHEGAGHWPHHEDPARFLAGLERWLARVAIR